MFINAMMQLVGYAVWEESGSEKIIDNRAVASGIHFAKEEFRKNILKSTLRELSRQDVNFLKAMLPDAEESRLTDIAARMKKTTGYASTYKTRLFDAGVIEEHENSSFSFVMPAFKAYLEEQG